ncbi:MAG TPA: methyltransferase domain-containing protein [Acidimicrobiia bacterium]|nr:methyltransferase domain-containing protein [Acidimicrobiia bacterium]
MEGETYDETYYSATYRDYFRQNPTHKLEFYRSVVEQHSPSRRPTRVLDIGCGLGGFLGGLRQRDPERNRWDLTGVDVSEFAISTNTSTYPDEKFKACAAEDISDLGTAFDVITAFDILEHLQWPDRAASAISSCLTDDGTLVLVVPVYDGPLGPVVRLLDNDQSHVQLQSRQWWLDWTNTHFTVTSWFGIFRMLTPWHQYLHIPTKRLRRVAPAILITARKG